MKDYKVGLGIVTCNRPQFFEKAVFSVIRELEPLLECIVTYNDGNYFQELSSPYTALQMTKKGVYWGSDDNTNSGVAVSKNQLMEYLLEKDCDYIFIMEDDMEIKSPKAITEYIKLSQETGIEHFNFAHHGKMNPYPVKVEGDVAYYPNCVGAYSFYTKNCLNKVGLLDEHFYNAWEHVEHTARIAREGLTSPFWLFADHKNSQEWIEEQPNALESSVIRNNPDWNTKMLEGLQYWKSKDGIGIPQR